MEDARRADVDIEVKRPGISGLFCNVKGCSGVIYTKGVRQRQIAKPPDAVRARLTFPRAHVIILL